MPRPPNLVLVLTTQWRWDMLGYLGNAQVRTPELDGIAASGVSYSQAVTPHPFGPMARAALMTGVPSPANGVKDYYDPLPLDAHTLALSLGALGYETAYFGKWHLSQRSALAALVGDAHAREIVPPERRGGFDFWEGFESGFLLNDPWLHGTRLAEPRQFSGYQSDVLCSRAAEWWKTSRTGKPTLLVVSLEAPHPPYTAPAPIGESPSPESLVLSPNVPRGALEARVRAELAGYLRHIRATDAAVGRLWRAVGGTEEDTHFLFTSVHGDMHGSHGLLRKGWPFEESVRVPLITARSRNSRRRIEDRPVSLLQLDHWMRTLAAGEEWAPSGEPVAISMPSVVKLAWQCNYVWRGLRSAERKIVLDANGQPLFFFDLQRDPFEQRNLCANPHHASELEEWRLRTNHVAAGFF